MDRHLDQLFFPQQMTNFRLVKVRPREQRIRQQALEHMPMKSLKSRSHICKLSA
jgi:hypothetical protein